MIMLSSVLHLLHRRFGRRCLLIGAGVWNYGLYRGHADVERVLCVARHFPFALSLTWWRILWALHRSSPGPIYVCERQPRQVARIRRMLALSGIDRSRCLFIGAVVDQEEHWVNRFVRLAQSTPPAVSAVQYPMPPSAKSAAPRLCVSDLDRSELNAWLRQNGWLGRKLVLLQPGNFRSMSRRREQWRLHNADDKAWPVESWVALSRRVLATLPDALVMLCGAPEEGSMLQAIRDRIGLPEVVAAALTLRQLLAVSESSHSMISVDTGPAHAAAALGLPVVVMFGSESQRQWLPRSPSGSVVVGIGGPPNSSRVDQIPVDEVVRAWCSILPAIRLQQQSPAWQCECAS